MYGLDVHSIAYLDVRINVGIRWWKTGMMHTPEFCLGRFDGCWKRL